MIEHQQYMQRCLQLAAKDQFSVAPNPMVGAVIVNQGVIIGEGYHRTFGGPHAEVEAVNQVINKDLIIGSTVYVSLEPCAHFGKTPPCAHLLIHHQVGTVVVACLDPNPLVAGKGIELLKNAGINVITGVLEKEALELNKSFITYHEQKRPYIILKWAQTADKFSGRPEKSLLSPKITDTFSNTMVHHLRSTTQAILVGYNTAMRDNPALNVRHWYGSAPIRIIIDVENTLPKHLKVLNDGGKTIVFTSKPADDKPNVSYVKLNSRQDIIPEILSELYDKNIQSLLVEGGPDTLKMFIEKNIWDEAHIFESNHHWGEGKKAAELKNFEVVFNQKLISDNYQIFKPKPSS
jgi:diaminohydroxyphosphoribosylaminopyrimidine deaminase/5-amino-6-(5-phosphoribosylamino)uracil reductase